MDVRSIDNYKLFKAKLSKTLYITGADLELGDRGGPITFYNRALNMYK